MPNVFRYSQPPAAFTASAPGRTSQPPPLGPLTAGDGPSLQSQNQLLFPFIAFHKINIDISYAKKGDLSTEFWDARGDACPGRGVCAGTGNFPCAYWALSVCKQTLNKNHAGWKGTGGIHPAILMNCAAQAS